MTRVMIVEDSPCDRAWLQEMVADTHEVATFGNGQDAVNFYIANGADCVLIDRRLEGEDGMVVLQQLRARDMFCPAILLTGEVDDVLNAIARRAGVDLVLSKRELTAEQLNETIGEAIRAGDSARARAGLPTRHWKLMLVDDDPDERAFLKDQLLAEADNIRVVEFATGAEAIENFRTEGADCVLLDYLLGPEDGLGILSSFKALAPHVPVIMLTGKGSEGLAAASIRTGATDYLIKGQETGRSLCDLIRNAISLSRLQAKMADQEEERRQFLRVLVHDLRAPFRQIRQLSDDMAEDLARGLHEDLPAMLATQRDVALRAVDLIDALNRFALLDGDFHIEQVPLAEAAAAARTNLAAIIRDRGAEVTIGPLPTVPGNPARLSQMLQNLIQNGMKYNESAVPKVEVGLESDDGRVPGSTFITVRDNGIGIPEEYQTEIFAPLRRLWGVDRYEGSGLGLAVCQKIAEQHGGKIWCTSTPGAGSTFHIRLPTGTT